jgi:hypothetical protein
MVAAKRYYLVMIIKKSVTSVCKSKPKEIVMGNFAILVENVSSVRCLPMNTEMVKLAKRKETITPVINDKGTFVQTNEELSVPVVSIYRPATGDTVYLAWTPEVENYLGVPLVTIEEQKAEIATLEERIDVLKEQKYYLEDKNGSLHIELQKLHATPLWKLLLKRIMVKLNVF